MTPHLHVIRPPSQRPLQGRRDWWRWLEERRAALARLDHRGRRPEGLQLELLDGRAA